MAIGIAGGSYFALWIDGNEIPLQELKFLGLCISSHYLYKQPIGHIKLIDPNNLLKKYNLSDGATLVFKLGRVHTKVYLYMYRLFNTKMTDSSQGKMYTISFIDIADVWRLQTAKTSLDASSSEAMKKIADYCGLDFMGVENTQDKQVWLPMAEPFCDFARRIGKSGYCNDTSCMMLGIDMYANLRYINTNGSDFGKSKIFRYGSEASGGIYVTDIKFKQESGTANTSGGYGQTNHQFTVEGNKRIKASKVRTRRMSENTNINASLAGSVGDGKVKVMPIDGGNTHPNSLKAKNQNERVSLLLSSSVSLLTMLDPDIEILENCYLEYFESGKKDPEKSGLYLVIGKAINLTQDLQYYERYQIVREGNNKGKGTI